MFKRFKLQSKMTKFTNVIVLTALIMMALSGCAPQAPAGPTDVPKAEVPAADAGAKKAVADITLGVSFPSLMSATWQATEENLKAYQSKLGFKVVQTVADNDVNKQLSQIEDMIAKKVDAIIVDPIDSKAIMSSVAAANAAGIPIILFDRPPSDMKGVASFVGSDNNAFGQEAARQLKAYAEKNKVELKVLVLIGALTDENAKNRNEGFQKVAKELGINMVAEVPTEWKPEKALNGVTNALQANPDINAIFIPSDYLLPSVLSALKTNGKLIKYGQPGHIMLAQIDGDGNGAKSLQDGYSLVDIAHDPVAWAQKPVDNAITLIQGGKVDPVFNALPGVVGTVDNIKELGNGFWGNAYIQK